MTGCERAARVVIFAARRTGSSLLVQVLRAHPQVLMHGELLHVRDLADPEDGYAGRELPDDAIFNVRRAQPLRLLRHVQCHPEGHAAVGLKIFRDHTRPVNWPVLTHWCTTCIILKRADVHAQYRSLMLARTTGRWKGRSESAGQSDAHVSIMQGFAAWRRNQEVWYQEVERQLSNRGRNASVVRLVFEDHLAGGRAPRTNLTALWRALHSRTRGVVASLPNTASRRHRTS